MKSIEKALARMKKKQDPFKGKAEKVVKMKTKLNIAIKKAGTR